MDFWARRKAAVEAETRAVDAQRLEDAAAVEAKAQEEKTDAELLEELGLPEPETLGPEGDFKAFLEDGVPQRLKSRALRCLWRSNPILANVDGLVDYGEDFTDASCVIENMQTAYQVGKGMLAHVEELARQAEARAANETLAEGRLEGDAPPVPVTDTASSGPPSGSTQSAATSDGFATDVVDISEPAPDPSAPSDHPAPVFSEEDAGSDFPSRRRMAFTFDDQRA